MSAIFFFSSQIRLHAYLMFFDRLYGCTFGSNHFFFCNSKHLVLNSSQFKHKISTFVANYGHLYRLLKTFGLIIIFIFEHANLLRTCRNFFLKHLFQVSTRRFLWDKCSNFVGAIYTIFSEKCGPSHIVRFPGWFLPLGSSKSSLNFLSLNVAWLPVLPR